MDTLQTVKLVEVVGDRVVQLAGMVLMAYGFRLISDYLKYRVDTTGKGIFEPRTDTTDGLTGHP